MGSLSSKVAPASTSSALSNAVESGETKKVVELASRIGTLSLEQVRERYHELIDKRPDLSSIERFELNRIKTRLDAEDVDPEQELRDREWERRRNQVLNSIENLIDRLRQADL